MDIQNNLLYLYKIINMFKLVCINNKAKKGHCYLKDETFNLTIGKTYEFYTEYNMESYIKMVDDNDQLIIIYIVRNFFETIENNRDRKLNELVI
jgi:hypothetical protein